jgi:hypothetical protein
VTKKLSNIKAIKRRGRDSNTSGAISSISAARVAVNIFEFS